MQHHIEYHQLTISQTLKAWLSCIRYSDAHVMAIPAIVGLTFSSGKAVPENIIKLLSFFMGIFLLMAHIFSFNDWTGRISDSQDPNKSQHTFLAKGVTAPEMLLLSEIFGVFSLILLGFLSYRLLVLTIMILVFSVLYSFPNHRLQGKSIPFFSSALHIIGGSLTFLLGYALFAEIDSRGISISLYFGILFTAGHLTQEVQDSSGDALNKIPTHAVRFGKFPVFLAAFILFSFSFGYLVWLAYSGYLPVFMIYLVALYPIYVVMVWKTYKNGLVYDNVRRLRSQYRLLYAGIILIISISSLFSA
jgi:4-hydroxybenzoate polyprenyltransferase